MNVLDYLSEKQSNSVNISHPLENASTQFKYLYCFGLSTLAFGYKQHLQVTEQYFSTLLHIIKLDITQQAKLKSAMLDSNFEYRINEVFELLKKKDEQYCFIADLYKLSYFGLLSPTYCQDIIQGYMQVFGFSEVEKRFFKDFTDLANHAIQVGNSVSSYINTDLTQAISLYEKFADLGYFIPYSILQYIFPQFHTTAAFSSLTLEKGEFFYLDRPCTITGTVTVKNCSTFFLEHTTLHINGNIFVENGKVLIKNSDIIIEDCNADFFISVTKSNRIIIENSTIVCNSKTAFLLQDSGCLKIYNTHIKNTTRKRAIVFAGSCMDIGKSTFENCLEGAILNHAQKELRIDSCTFLHCTAEHGGAIYSNSLGYAAITSCTFLDCNAKFIGGAVYFVTKKYEQRVEHCHFENCYPKDSQVFNSLNEAFYFPF